MKLNTENMLNSLKEANLLRNENHCFSCYIMPSIGQYALMGAFAGLLNSCSGYIINTTEEGVGVLPLSSMTGRPMIDKGIMLPYQNISKVDVKKSGIFGERKVTILTTNNEAISFKVSKKVLVNPNHQESVNYFLSKFNIQ